MNEKMNRLRRLINQVQDLHGAAAVLGWDQQTCMPPGGAAARAEQLGTLQELAHKFFTSPEVGALLDSLADHAKELDPDSDDACLLRVLARNYAKKTRVPSSLVAEIARTSAAAEHVWEQARAASDFTMFSPHLEKLVSLMRDYSACFKPFAHPYDPLLDDYESGLNTESVRKVFEGLRPRQVELIRKIASRPQLSDEFMNGDFDAQKQLEFGSMVISKFGYDWQRGRQDRSAHPFTSTLGFGDVRITTRVMPRRLDSALFSSMHEAGHALYEQGMSQSLMRTPLADGASLGVHESQSRLWENIVGRSKPFWKHFLPHLKEAFPQLSGIGLDDFYRGINKVQPSLIRVESDEATYNLHVMLRFELEIALIEGTLNVAELPEAWNAKMSEYLGLEPGNDAEGVLQDVHWAAGLFGYFPTYALGNLLASQIWQCAGRELHNLPGQIANGEFSELREWLREKIHRHGAKYEPSVLVRRLAGADLSPEPYLRYLNDKYGEIYGL
ncbi:MAG: carboxypeptidase [Lentisphaerae bacterium GWF2_52_8]|nr:MAG: carboxypeptidase [Lentisphaerae bacterium GWF2_52_8]